MFPEQLKGAPADVEEAQGKKADESAEDVAEDIAGAPIQEVIDAVLDLPAKDLQHLYEAIGKVIKTKKKETAPKEEAAPEDQFNAQDMARSFM
jgi:hypothetical protein